MARLNQSQFALLGLLSIAPQSGYDLKQLSGWSIGHFWRESYGQIYPTLKKMANEGLVRCKTDSKRGRPERKVYSLTPQGLKTLEAWLGRPAGEEVRRNEFLLKLFFGGLRPMAVNREQLVEHWRQSQATLANYKAVRERLQKEAARHPQKPWWLMTLSYGEHMEQAALQWSEAALKKIEKLEGAGKKM